MISRNIVVTGGLGFIGSAVCEQLLQAGERVTIVDSMVSNVVTPHHFTARFAKAEVAVIPVAEPMVHTAAPMTLSRLHES